MWPCSISLPALPPQNAWGGWAGNNILGSHSENYSRGDTLQHCCLADCTRVCGAAALASLPFPHALIMPGVGGWVIKFGTANTKNYSRGYTLQHCCLADGARVCAPAALPSLPFTHAQKHAWNIVNFEHFALLINKKKKGGVGE